VTQGQALLLGPVRLGEGARVDGGADEGGKNEFLHAGLQV